MTFMVVISISFRKLKGGKIIGCQYGGNCGKIDLMAGEMAQEDLATIILPCGKNDPFFNSGDLIRPFFISK